MYNKMFLHRWIVLLLSLIFMCHFTDGDVHCFKKLQKGEGNRPDTCRELLYKETASGERKEFRSPRGCCKNGGVGFVRGRLVAKGRKRSKYACNSCESLKTALGPTDSTTLAPPTTNPPTTVDLFEGNPNRTGWSKWGPWTQCSVTCGYGAMMRRRICGDGSCGGSGAEETETNVCFPTLVCPVHGGWGPWGPWSECPVTCGGGTKTRTRRCNNPTPQDNGLDCPGNSTDTIECNTELCSVDGGWSEWYEWSSCSGSCGNGVKNKMRECDNPSPAHGGADCSGNNTVEKSCRHSNPCPIDGGWSLWYEWSSCTVSCGRGVRERIRKCVAPRRQYGGADCVGNRTDEKLCYHSTPCPVDGSWTEWQPWAACLAAPCTGESGYTTRKRTCKNPQPRFNGKQCEGNSTQSQDCVNNDHCPVDGGWCEWANYTECLPSNTGRFKMRIRDCACPVPESGGSPCNGIDYEVTKCPPINRFGLPCPDTSNYLDDESETADMESSGFFEEFEC